MPDSDAVTAGPVTADEATAQADAWCRFSTTTGTDYDVCGKFFTAGATLYGVATEADEELVFEEIMNSENPDLAAESYLDGSEWAEEQS